MLSDPDRPSRISPCALSRRFPGLLRFRFLCIGFRFPNVVATCICCYEAELLQEGANFPTAHRIPCVRFVWVVRLVSVLPIYATLSMVGWLCLYLRGLSPHQKRQASLGALGNCFFHRSASLAKTKKIASFFILSALLNIEKERK